MTNSISILSLGGGVQSTALALMAERGMIEKPVAAIFSDTGDEPEKLYAHIEWIRSQVSFPIYIVKEGNGLGADFLAALSGEKNRASQPPFFVKAPEMSSDEIEKILCEPEPRWLDFSEKEKPFSLKADDEELEEYNSPFDIEWKDWNQRRQRALNKDEGGMLWRACTVDYKIMPIRRQVRVLMKEHGAKHCFSMIGISTDEMQRLNESGVKFITNIHPLIDLGWSRKMCEQWLWDEFGIIVPKSACRYCPYRSNAGWRYMKLHEPVEFERTCVFDETMRESQGKKIRGAGIIGQLFVHRSFTPLRTANLEDLPGQKDFGFEQECHGMCGY